MVTLKRVGVSSAFKIGAMIGLITSLITGLIFVGLQAAFVSTFTRMAASSMGTTAGDPMFQSADLNFLTAFGMAGLCVFFVVYVVASTIFGGIGGILYALAYNLASRWVGGLEVELEEEPGKRKRSSVADDIYE